MVPSSKNYAEWKVYEKRTELNNRGLLKSGVKEDLVRRLEEDDEEKRFQAEKAAKEKNEREKQAAREDATKTKAVTEKAEKEKKDNISRVPFLAPARKIMKTSTGSRDAPLSSTMISSILSSISNPTTTNAITEPPQKGYKGTAFLQELASPKKGAQNVSSSQYAASQPNTSTQNQVSLSSSQDSRANSSLPQTPVRKLAGMRRDRTLLSSSQEFTSGVGAPINDTKPFQSNRNDPTQVGILEGPSKLAAPDHLKTDPAQASTQLHPFGLPLESITSVFGARICATPSPRKILVPKRASSSSSISPRAFRKPQHNAPTYLILQNAANSNPRSIIQETEAKTTSAPFVPITFRPEVTMGIKRHPTVSDTAAKFKTPDPESFITKPPTSTTSTSRRFVSSSRPKQTNNYTAAASEAPKPAAVISDTFDRDISNDRQPQTSQITTSALQPPGLLVMTPKPYPTLVAPKGPRSSKSFLLDNYLSAQTGFATPSSPSQQTMAEQSRSQETACKLPKPVSYNASNSDVNINLFAIQAPQVFISNLPSASRTDATATTVETFTGPPPQMLKPDPTKASNANVMANINSSTSQPPIASIKPELKNLKVPLPAPVPDTTGEARRADIAVKYNNLIKDERLKASWQIEMIDQRCSDNVKKLNQRRKEDLVSLDVKVEKERVESERLEKERKEMERPERLKIEQERVKAERIEKGQFEKQRVEQELTKRKRRGSPGPKQPASSPIPSNHEPAKRTRREEVVPCYNVVESAPLRPRIRGSYVFIDAINIPLADLTISRIRDMVVKYRFQVYSVRADRTGYYITFEDSFRGDREAYAFMNRLNGQYFWGRKMEMQLNMRTPW